MRRYQVRDILAPIAPDQLREQFAHWHWLAGDELVPLGQTLTGDWLLTDATGAIHLLDTIEATLSLVAGNADELEARLQSPDERDELFLEGSARAAIGGRPLSPGHCLGFRVPPILGGATDRSNLEVVLASTYQAWTGRLHEALSRLPPDAKVTGVDVSDSGQVSVRWV